MNIKKKLKSNKGYTLVEIFLAMMLASILTMLLMTILYSETSIINDMDMSESAKIFGDTAMKYMRDSLSDAMDITLYPSTETIETNGVDEGVFYIQEGKLLDNRTLIAGGMGYRYNIEYNVVLNNVQDTDGKVKPVIYIEIYVYDKRDNVQYMTNSTFANITMMTRGKYFQDTDYFGDYELGDAMENPRILYTMVTQDNIFR